MRDARPRVVYWNGIPSPYMVDRFNALAERGNLDFEAWFSARTEPGRSWEVDESAWRFPSRYLPALRIGGRGLAVPWPLLRRSAPHVLVSLYAGASFLLGWRLARLRRVRTAFWCEVTFDRWVPRRRWKETAKRYAFPRVDGILTAGRDGRDFALRYGARPERIFYAPHVIDVGHFARGRDAALPERDRLREELGLRGVTFLYVGRLWWGKGLDCLLDAFASLQRRAGDEVSLLLVGDGPEEARLLRRCLDEGIANVVCRGFVHGRDLPRYYAASDVLVFPTLGDPYGLVVDEAMACSLPVIATSAAGEIRDRVHHGKNGFVVPPADGTALADRMAELAADAGLRARMGAESAGLIQGHTPERWAEDFERAMEQILSLPRT